MYASMSYTRTSYVPSHKNMARFQFIGGLVVVICFCTTSSLGRECHSSSGPISCPTEFDSPDLKFCCGRPSDTFGEYCCGIEVVNNFTEQIKPTPTSNDRPDSPRHVLQKIVLLVRHNTGIVIGIACGSITVLVIAVLACCRLCSCCPYAKCHEGHMETFKLKEFNRVL